MRYSVNRDNAFWRILEGEAVIISAETSYYFSLNKSGTFVWSLLLEQSLEPDEIVSQVAEQYGRPAAEVSGDVQQVLESLRAENLILAE